MAIASRRLAIAAKTFYSLPVMRVTLALFLALLALCCGPSAHAREPAPPHALPEMVALPGGCFEMGDAFGQGQPDERPLREVCLKPFALAVNEVTVGSFQEYVAETGLITWAETNHCLTRAADGKLAEGGGRWSAPGFAQDLSHPVVCVGATEAEGYAAWLSRKTGKPYRLPSEAEWEFACRAGGRHMAYCTATGELTRADANYAGVMGKDRFAATAPVRSFAPNPSGLYGMSGNVYEWVRDSYAADAYTRLEGRDPLRLGPGERVKRGGSWAAPGRFLRAANRGSSPAPANDLGFRLALDLGP